MNGDLGTLILIGIIIVAVVLLIKRLTSAQQNPYTKPGNEYPHHNDPNISSHGGFGGNQQQGMNRPQNDDPNIESHGGFGGSGGSNYRQPVSRSNTEVASAQRTPQKQAENTRRNDDPNVSSHGGFGGQR